MTKISELRPFAKRVDVVVRAISKNEIREVTSKIDNSAHRVTEAVVGDDTGTVLLTIWDDMIEKVEDDHSYKISNAYTSLFKGSLRLNVGKYGTLEESEEEVAEVNTENNISEKEFKMERRFDSGGGNRRFDSGSGNRRFDNRDGRERRGPRRY